MTESFQRKGVWIHFLSLKGLWEGPVWSLFVNLRAPLCWMLLLFSAAPAAAAAAAGQAAGQTAHWLHGENKSCESLHMCFPHSEKQPSVLFVRYIYPRNSRVGALHAFYTLPLPLTLLALWAASPSAASRGLFVEQPASQMGTGALRTRPGFTLARCEAKFKVSPIFCFQSQFGEGSEDWL